MREEQQTKEKTMEAGSRVKVYEDPITCKKLEGEAVLVSCWYAMVDMEQWHVKFDDDEGLYSRAINKKIN